MKKRVHGLELEILATVKSEDSALSSAIMLQDFLFQLRQLYGNFIRPTPGYGGSSELRAILPNQAQVYIDQEDYLEICTPECSSIKDLVVQERIAKAIIRKHLEEFNENIDYSPTAKLCLFSSAADAFRKLSNGAHENYQFFGTSLIEQIKKILPAFLIARTILEGTGLFYIKSPLDSSAVGRKISFCLSQRMNFIRAVFASGTTGDGRPLISDKGGDPLVPINYRPSQAATPSGRLHIIKGEHNQTPFGNFIKTGGVSLLLDMIEAGYFQDKTIPLFRLIKNNSIDYRLTELIDRDLECQRAYDFANLHHRIRLCDVLDMYAEWMLDFLTNPRWDEAQNNSPSLNQYLLRAEKLEVARQLKRVADCFTRQDIFALVGDVEWITKLWWFQDWLKTDYNIEISNDDLSLWADFDQFLSLICRDRKIRLEIIDRTLQKDLFWHSLDPAESDYLLLEECGLINPLVIDEQEIDLSTDGRFDEAPQNPPNRSLARKKLWDFMHKIGLKNCMMTDWSRCWFVGRDSVCISSEKFYAALKYPPACPDAYEKFPWGKNFYFERPEENNLSDIDAFINEIKEIINVTDD